MLPENVRRLLRELRRDNRGTVRLMEKQADILRNAARIESTHAVRAGMQAAVNLWPDLIAEYRAIAAKADDHLRRDDITPDEFEALAARVNLADAKVLALGEELAAALLVISNAALRTS